jgi:hypothetical protein
LCSTMAQLLQHMHTSLHAHASCSSQPEQLSGDQTITSHPNNYHAAEPHPSKQHTQGMRHRSIPHLGKRRKNNSMHSIDDNRQQSRAAYNKLLHAAAQVQPAASRTNSTRVAKLYSKLVPYSSPAQHKHHMQPFITARHRVQTFTACWQAEIGLAVQSSIC